MKRPNKKKRKALSKKVIPLHGREPTNIKPLPATVQRYWLFQLYGINSEKAA